jgi:serine/threonine protein kinase
LWREGGSGVMEGAGEKRMYPVTAAEYKLLEEIGQGVSATVYRAICLPYKEVVAIKALDLEKCNGSLVRGLCCGALWLEFDVLVAVVLE